MNAEKEILKYYEKNIPNSTIIDSQLEKLEDLVDSKQIVI